MKPAENSSARRIIFAFVVLVTVCLLSLIIAGVTSLISLAERIHPVAGSIVFWTLILAAGFFALYCVIAYAGLPAALVPPEEKSGPKHDAFLEALRLRLAANPRTRGKLVDTEGRDRPSDCTFVSGGGFGRQADSKYRIS